MPAVRSVTLGIWAGVGSRDETPRLAGASHYLEHLLFKGTRRRSARDIAEAMDAVGGETNAFTSKEYTCFYARTLDRDLPLAVDVLVDMLRNSKMASADVDAERTVILEEIGMHNDAPDDIIHEPVRRGPVRRPPAGPAGAGHGRLDHQHAARHHRPLLAAPLRARQPGGGGGRQPGARPGGRAVRRGVRQDLGGRAHRPSGGPARAAGPRQGSRSGASRPSRPMWSLGSRGLSRADPRRFALGVLNVAFGGGVSFAAVPGGSGEARPGLLDLLPTPPSTPRRARSRCTPEPPQAHPRRAGDRP